MVLHISLFKVKHIDYVVCMCFVICLFCVPGYDVWIWYSRNFCWIRKFFLLCCFKVHRHHHPDCWDLSWEHGIMQMGHAMTLHTIGQYCNNCCLGWFGVNTASALWFGPFGALILRIALMTGRAWRQVCMYVKCYFVTQHLFDPQSERLLSSTLLVVALWSSSTPLPYTCAVLA